MKRYFNVLPLAVLIIGLWSCGTQKVTLDELPGTWVLSSNTADSLLRYLRVEEPSDPTGSVLTISPDSSLVDAFVMACREGSGGPSKFFSEGTWSLEKKGHLLKSTVPLDLSGNLFRIESLDAEKLVLIKVNPPGN